jgi:hypothetical protein
VLKENALGELPDALRTVIDGGTCMWAALG